LRLAVVGPRGSGKSIQARNLAEKLDLFHFKFRDRLQEMIIGKIKKPVGPEFEEEKEQDQDEYLNDLFFLKSKTVLFLC
jgi:adenylate kinase family enzyme